MSVQKSLQVVKNVAKAFALVFAVFSVASYIISLALGPILFFSTSDGLSVAAKQIHQIPIDVFMVVTIPIPLGTSMGVLFAGIWAAFVVCSIFAWLGRGGFPRSVSNIFTKSISIAKTNFLLIMPLVATGLVYAIDLIQRFQETQGVQTGSLNFPPATSQYLILLNLAFAPLREEFAFRLTSIGIPLGVFLVIHYRSDQKLSGPVDRVKLLLLAILSPERAKLKMGYRNVTTNGLLHGISPLEWGLIIITSVAFGSAHYLLGGGWELGKITTAALAGFVFGIVYVAYGAYAPILMHWFFNYYFTVLELGGTTYGGAFQLFSNLTESVVFLAGPVILVVFLMLTALRIADSLSLRAMGMSGKSA